MVGSKIIPYHDEKFWNDYLGRVTARIMEDEMYEESPIRPPDGHSSNHDSQFMAVVNQTKLLAGYCKWLEKMAGKTESEICDLIKELVGCSLETGFIINEDGSHTPIAMKLVAVTWYPAEFAIRSDAASARRLIARKHYVVHYNGF